MSPCLLLMELWIPRITPERGPVWTTGVMMDSDLLPISLPLVRVVPCGPHHHRITAAYLWQVGWNQIIIQAKLIFDADWLAASINLTALQRNVSRQDIECPGDTIPYMCSVQSNSETVQLRWLITFPGQDAITVLYSNDSDQNIMDRVYLDMNITTTLIVYSREDEFIESELELTVLQNIPMNGTMLECRSEGLDSELRIVSVNTSGTIK